MFYILYVVIGLVIGTIIIHSDEKVLYNQLTNKERSKHNDHDKDVLVFMICWYYLLWPFPLFRILWMAFWKALYISLQIIIMSISQSGEFLKNRFLPELLSSLKKKRRNK